MRVAVCGLRHLGTVATACLAEAGHTVLAWDSTEHQINEPGLGDLTMKGIEAGNIYYCQRPEEVIGADIVWVTFDTPIVDGKAQVDVVFKEAGKVLMHCKPDTLVLVSSQLPVGSIAKFQEKYTTLNFACSPENLRSGSAIECFKNPGRVVLGTADRANTREKLQTLFLPFTRNLLWVSVESAEFIKHAINAWLATSIAFANELGDVAIKYGASPVAVEMGMKSDPRIGDKAYLRYNAGGLGAHLTRDLTYLLEMAPEIHVLRGVQRASDDWETARGN